MKKYIYILICTVFIPVYLCAINPNDVDYKNFSWKHVATQMPDSWYGTSDAKEVAENVLKYQCEIGGWPKNTSFHKSVNEQEMAQIKATGIGATFDNDATTMEMIFLAKIYAQQPDEKYKKAFEKALNYIFEAQYKNGGWPQFYPYRSGRTVSYSAHITYNDDAMTNVMNLLKNIYQENELYAALSLNEDLIKQSKTSFDKGVECILNTQIVRDGKPTVWCAQHDAVTLAPAKARSYELESFSGDESVDVVMLLMNIENPDEKIIKAIQGAKAWFETHNVKGLRYQKVRNTDGSVCRKLVEDADASLLWARFYDLDTELPFFCSRDGVKRTTVEEISGERQNGYNWYTDAPARFLAVYPEWARKWNVED